MWLTTATTAVSLLLLPALSSSSSAAAAAAPVASLTDARLALLALEDAIVHTALSRAALPPFSQSEELPLAAATLALQAPAYYSPYSANLSVDPAFASRPPLPPFLDYARTDPARWGDNSTISSTTTTTIVDFYYASLLPALTTAYATQDPQHVGVNGSLPLVVPAGAALLPVAAAGPSAALLALLAQRIAFGGKAVADAKLAADAGGALCALIRAGDAAGVRAAITVPAQEALVLERVFNKTATWGAPWAAVGSTSAATAVQRLYHDFVIKMTSDMEVAVLLAKPECQQPDS
ncbi:hypothetical protein DFJ73DRAFT_792671 [Zopfochytrium polystomum]|nr:hypothetical protein DFJ73DRAFT_792671 [Zopfochytrium polystomum]